jgi:hypothetical protein
MEESILVGLMLVILFMGVYYIHSSIKSRPKDDKYTPSESRQDLLWGCFLIIAAIIVGIYTYYLQPRDIATEILKTSDPKSKNELCDSLLKLKADPDTLKQYMIGSESEKSKICDTVSKTILKIV